MTVGCGLRKISLRKEREHGIERSEHLSKERLIEESAKLEDLKDRQPERLFT